MYSLRNSIIELKNRKGTALKKSKKGLWLHITWPQYADRIESIAYSLLTMNIQRNDAIAIFSRPRPKWCFTDCAIISAGAISVPIYNSISNEDLAYIINKSKIKILFCEDIYRLKQWKEIIHQCPTVEKVICYDDCWDKDVHPLRWDLFLTLGEELKQQNPTLLQQISETLEDSDLATIVFTSGTTGTPKGVPITHEQIDNEVQATFPTLNITQNDISLSILPYAHILGRLELWGHICTGYTIAFSENIDSIQKNIREINPSIMITVPRVLEKIYARMQSYLSENPIKKQFFYHAQKVISQIEKQKQVFRSIKITDRLLQKASQKYLFNESHRIFGKNLRFIVSGGAPLNPELSQFFLVSGVLILEGYGLSETTGAICLNTPSSFQFGTVGKPLPNVQIRIADDNEILVKSKTVIKHYLNETESFDWFPTGDIGHFNDDGFLVISDRKKDLIKTSSGKYVIPAKLEKNLLDNPFISHCHIHGDKRKYIVALVSLNKSKIVQWASQNNLSYANTGDLTQHPKVKHMIQTAIAKINKNLANHETIKNFTILRDEFSIDTGELTPSFKVKRKFCDLKFADTIDNLYSLESI